MWRAQKEILHLGHGSYVVIRKAVFHVFLRDTGHQKK